MKFHSPDNHSSDSFPTNQAMTGKAFSDAPGLIKPEEGRGMNGKGMF
jgi:hypothetical protein